MVGHPQWADDPSLGSWAGRNARIDELRGAIDAWMKERTVEEVIDVAAAMRIAVVPIGNGERTPTFDHFVERGVFVDNPGGFVQPRMPYRLSMMASTVVERAPSLGEHDSAPFGLTSAGDARRSTVSPVRGSLPLEG